jgi:hypothetical protein
MTESWDSGDRWQRLFADLELQVAAEQRAELDGEVPDRTRSARGEVTLLDRLRASSGALVTLRCLGGAVARGRVGHVGCGWVVVVDDDSPSLSLAVTTAVVSGEGVSAHATPARRSAVADRVSLAMVLRSVARDRSPVRLQLADGRVLEGTIDAVGHDHVDVAEHRLDEPRRPAAVRRTQLVAFTGLAVLSAARATSSLAW